MNLTKAPRAERRWTDSELHKLYQDYFDRLPGTCPVCGCEVGMMMDHKDVMTIISIRCRGCGNTATVLT
jgi:hypothetical protein